MHRLPFLESEKEWAKRIMDCGLAERREKVEEGICQSGYDAELENEKLADFYLTLIK